MVYSKPGGSWASHKWTAWLSRPCFLSVQIRGLATEQETHSRRTLLGPRLWVGNSEIYILISDLEKSRTLPCKKLLNSDFQTIDCDPRIRCNLHIILIITVTTQIKEREGKEIEVTNWETGNFAFPAKVRESIATWRPSFDWAFQLLSHAQSCLLSVACYSKKFESFCPKRSPPPPPLPSSFCFVTQWVTVCREGP